MTVCACEAGLLERPKGLNVNSLFHWAACFKSVAHSQFLSSGAFVPIESYAP